MMATIAARRNPLRSVRAGGRKDPVVATPRTVRAGGRKDPVVATPRTVRAGGKRKDPVVVNTPTVRRKVAKTTANTTKPFWVTLTPPTASTETLSNRSPQASDTSTVSSVSNLNDQQRIITALDRKDAFTESTWWMVDLDSDFVAPDQGATPLVKRCMRMYGWDETKARKILKGYSQFLLLKKNFKDWDASLLSPSTLIDQMWHAHILDVNGYAHDCMLLCGHLVGHNPDGMLDRMAKKARIDRTLHALEEHFDESKIDDSVWLTSCQQEEKAVREAAKPKEEAAKKRDVQFMKSLLRNKSIAVQTHKLKSMRGNKAKDYIQVVVKVNGSNHVVRFSTIHTMKTIFKWVLCDLFNEDSDDEEEFEFWSRNRHYTTVWAKVPMDRTGQSCGFRDGDVLSIERIENASTHDSSYGASRSPTNPHRPIRIIVCDQAGEEFFFKIKRSDRMVDLFQAYSFCRGAKIGGLRFLCDGQRIDRDATPSGLLLQDHDRIDVMLEQTGC